MSLTVLYSIGKEEPGILTRPAPVPYKLQLLAEMFNEGTLKIV